SSRICDEKSFRGLLAAKEKVSSPYFSVRYMKRPGDSFRLGIVLPKKKFAA
ncbi:MAG: ribonuclease P protein component, partial [Deltaproteobacteria bacterium]|nr:ribonuclease P protein component [Deltaproteobacteria bacterium]